jgi:hypothetical protein
VLIHDDRQRFPGVDNDGRQQAVFCSVGELLRYEIQPLGLEVGSIWICALGLNELSLMVGVWADKLRYPCHGTGAFFSECHEIVISG